MYQKKKNYVSKRSKTLLVIAVGLLVLSSFPTIVLSDEGTPNIPEITKNGPEKAYPDEIFDYTISFANEGDGTAENVSVVDALPEYVDYQDSTPQGSYDLENHTVTWNFPEVQSGQIVDITLTVQVKQDAPHGTGLYNDVELTYEDSQQNQYGPIYGFTIACVMAEPMIDVTCEAPATADAGQPFSYMISVYNMGYPSAINVEVVDYLSPDVIYDSSNPPGQYNQMDHTVSWVFGSIEPEETVIIELNVIAENGLPPATNLVNVVEAQWQDPELNEYDPVSDEDSTTITGDWIIGNGENVMRSSETIVVTGSVIVEDGGQLSLDDVNLKMKCPPWGGDFGIYIMQGGELNASNGTLIDAFETSEPYFVNNWGELKIMDIVITQIKGVLPDQGGIENFDGASFYCNQSVISASETVGITVAQGATATIDYSYIKFNGGDGIQAEGSTYIKNSVIENNSGSGIYWLSDDVDTCLNVENVLIEKNAIGIFCESPGESQGENIELENVCLRNNSIDNMMMYNFDPLLRGEYLQINENIVVISSDYFPAPNVTIKNDIQVKVLDDGYDPVPNASVIIDDWEDGYYDNYTDDEGFITGIEVIDKMGTPTECEVPLNYLTDEDLETMPYLGTYFEIIDGECQMQSGYYFNKLDEADVTYQEHEILVDSTYTALEGYEVINPKAGITASSSYDEHPAMFALDYDPITYWSADPSIGDYTLLIDLTDPQPIRYVNISYQFTGEQSWFEGQSYVIEGFNETTEEWEEMCSVENEENVTERGMEVPPCYWDENNSLGWVSKVRMRIEGWSSSFGPGIRLINVQDADADGLLNWYEELIGTDMLGLDTDGDGMSDYYEKKYGKDSYKKSWFHQLTPNYRYAVLIGIADYYGGNFDPWFWNDIMLAYYMLYMNRGFTHDNIYCLYDDGNMDPDNNYISWYPSYNIVDNPASLKAIEGAFYELKGKVTENDLLFLYLVDHGSHDKLDGWVKIYEGYISDYQLHKYLDNIPAGARKVITVDACFSGTFIDNVNKWTGTNRIFTTSAAYNCYAYGYRGKYGQYARYYLGALNGKYPNGKNGWTPLNAEYHRSDGEVSIKEAYMCDVLSEKKEERKPNYAMYDDNGDPWDPGDRKPDGPGYHGIFRDVTWNEGILGQDTYLGKPYCYFDPYKRAFPVKGFPYWQQD